ncbi:hypothetical protein B2J88_20125 [Rhodococcus sp. SRB_17]|uniref:hypothetical protein n=1 Tax=Acidovorax sp. SRB_24 TaxID=1962700 RepID=UPI00145C3A77|nr:hypothetical protein [Acidovorax sp. SRB_24]NMM75360.1 hypothetical protein [Acidovorax sp. SRB_24]NMM86646.1 hypothetical protein [Rhodococcus sp. SRB_17]
MSVRLVLTLTLTLAAALGMGAYRNHLVARGDAQGAARVQAAWNKQEAERSAATARDNATKFRNAERVTHENAQREAARQARDAAAAAAVRSLRAEIDRLRKRPDPYPAGDAGLAACAREATTGRELFGESAEAYSELAAEADGFRDQVAGLQDFARTVCRVPTHSTKAIHDF